MDENLTTLPARIAAEFRAESARQNLSNSGLASRIGISRQRMYGQLSGKQDPTLTTMAAIAEALNLPLSTLMKRAEAQSPAADRTAA